MKRTFNFGKIAAYGNRKINAVDVTIELREKDGNAVFSAVGYVWNAKHTDIITGGQCLDSIAKSHIKCNPTFKKIYRWWKAYHLNDMHAGTKEQEAALDEAVKTGKFPSRSASLYTEHCEYLKSIGLYEVELDGKPYQYGHGWVLWEIPREDIEAIEKLIKEGV